MLGKRVERKKNTWNDNMDVVWASVIYSIMLNVHKVSARSYYAHT